MSGKTFRSTANKRAIDTGKVSIVEADDLVKIWRTSQGDEKSISLADLAVGVIVEAGVGAGLSLDVDNKIQLGNDGAGIIDYSDDSVFTGGVQYIYNSVDKSMSSLFTDAEFRINTNWDSLIDSDSSSANFEIQSSGSSQARVDINKSVNGFEQKILFNPTTNLIEITDQINNKGLENVGDYEANFTARSLVTAQYVTSAIGAINVLATPLTGYTVGANTALAATDTILQAFQKTQGQINARVSGTITVDQIAFGSSANTISGELSLKWNQSTKRIQIYSPLSVLSATFGHVIGTGDGIFQLTNNIGSETLRMRGGAACFISHTFGFGIGTASPTNTLDVNGTARIRSISNGTGDFLTKSATGVITSRTASEVRTDIGALPSASLAITVGQVAFGTGTNTVGGDALLFWNNTTKSLGIGTSTTNARVHISAINNTHPTLGGSGNAINLILSGTDTLYGTVFYTNGSTGNGQIQQMRVDGTATAYALCLNPLGGNVGVGTITPTDKLDVNGSFRVQSVANGAGNFATYSATGVLQQRTAANVITDLALDTNYVTIATSQTITGAKIFSNALLVQEANTPILRLKTANNTQATINFRNSANEDQGGLQLDAGTGKLSLLTRTVNTDIEIFPHGTGAILLPNVASGTGDVLMLNGSNELVKGSGTPLTETSASFTPTLIDGFGGGGGGSYTFSTASARYVKTGSIVFFTIGLTSISTSGTPSSLLIIGGLPFSGTEILNGSITINSMTGSSISSSDIANLSAYVSDDFINFDDKTSSGAALSAVTFTSGSIWVSGYYEV